MRKRRAVARLAMMRAGDDVAREQRELQTPRKKRALYMFPARHSSWMAPGRVISLRIHGLLGIVMNVPRVKLDKVDQRILHDLQANGRISNIELARRAGISPP